MAGIEQLQSRADGILRAEEGAEERAAKLAALTVEEGGGHFSPFIPAQLERAVGLADRLMEVADEEGGEAGLEKALAEAEAAAEREDLGLVQHALGLFITHHREASRLAVPPIPPPPERRRPAVELADEEADPEAPMDWFREDLLANEHHRHWHLVYPTRGLPRPGGGRELQDRQGELFFYMHQQMLARYNAERLAVGLDAVEPFGDYRAPIPDTHGERPPNQRLVDVNRPDTGPLSVAELEQQRDTMTEATDTGAFEVNGSRIEVTAERLAAVEEPTIGTVVPGNWHHGYGHVLCAFVMVPQAGGEAGDIGDTATAIRDPFFWRWHKHIDDFSWRWQETLEPHRFDDAPPVSVTGVSLWLEAEPDADVDELFTRMAEAPFDPSTGDDRLVRYLDHDPFGYSLALENGATEPTAVTLRVFLAPASTAEDRRAWIEMDKFEHELQGEESTIVRRAGSLASVVRKPAARPPLFVQAAANDPHEQYCRCGWPFHMLLPRGTEAGMPLRLMVMATDWQVDRVGGDDECGSMSFCGARERYPDSREMGYPFNRPFAEGSTITDVLGGMPNVAVRDLSIRFEG